jgi:hypothetical protein
MRLINLFALVLLLCGCGSASVPVPQLRVANSGEETIEDLTVLFPDSQIVFGDVAAGSTTPYQIARDGVYGYAAYRYKVGALVVTQPVVDFVGASPLGRARFTYRLELNSSRTPRGEIRLIEVKKDG